MKNLRKIIAFFSLIFILGIFGVIITINTTLETKEIPVETVKVQKDTISLSKTGKIIKTV